jgi:hypothetical protein
MTRKEWDALKASGKLVELRPKDFAENFTDDFTYFGVGYEEEREAIGRKVRWMRMRFAQTVYERLGKRVMR